MESVNIGSTIVEKLVKDLDITFVNGFMMSVTVDEAAGDTIDWSNPDLIVVVNVKRKSIVIEDSETPTEKTTINRKNVLAIQERERVVVEATPEQKYEWNQYLKTQAN